MLLRTYIQTATKAQDYEWYHISPDGSSTQCLEFSEWPLAYHLGNDPFTMERTPTREIRAFCEPEHLAAILFRRRDAGIEISGLFWGPLMTGYFDAQSRTISIRLIAEFDSRDDATAAFRYLLMTWWSEDTSRADEQLAESGFALAQVFDGRKHPGRVIDLGAARRHGFEIVQLVETAARRGRARPAESVVPSALSDEAPIRARPDPRRIQELAAHLADGASARSTQIPAPTDGALVMDVAILTLLPEERGEDLDSVEPEHFEGAVIALGDTFTPGSWMSLKGHRREGPPQQYVRPRIHEPSGPEPRLDRHDGFEQDADEPTPPAVVPKSPWNFRSVLRFLLTLLPGVPAHDRSRSRAQYWSDYLATEDGDSHKQAYAELLALGRQHPELLVEILRHAERTGEGASSSVVRVLEILAEIGPQARILLPQIERLAANAVRSDVRTAASRALLSIRQSDEPDTFGKIPRFRG